MVKTKSEPNAVATLDQYRKGNFNVLVPTTHMQQISPFHRMRVEEVNIDPDPEGGEVFKVGSKKVGGQWKDVLSPGKPALLKLANAAGIIWNWRETKVLSASRDYALYQAVGAIRKPSGEWIPLKAIKEIDLTVIEEEVYEQNIKKAHEYADDSKKKSYLKGMSPEEWAKTQTRSNMIQWRKNKLMRAETGAMLRVIRALLNLKMQYSPDELSKPFVVPRVDFSPDYSDPEVRRMIAQEGIKATADLFGQASAPQQLAPAEAVGQAFSQPQAMPEMGEPIDIGTDEYSDDIDEGNASDGDLPWEQEQGGNQSSLDEELADAVVCQGCDRLIEDGSNWKAEQVIGYSTKNFGKPLCPDCQKTAKKGGGK